jgi:hypothetical protein
MSDCSRLVVASSLLLLLARTGSAQEDAAASAHRGVDKLLLGAGITLAGTYALTIVADHAIDNSVNFNEALVPAVGPFLAIAHYDDKVSPTYEGRNRDKALFALSGVVQSAALTVIVVRLFRGRGGVRQERVPAIAMAPLGRHGFVASCTFRF